MSSHPLPTYQSPRVRLARMSAAAMVAMGFTLVATQVGSLAAPPAPTPPPITLPYANSYLTTGNVATGAVDLPGAAANGVATGTIHMGGSPANPDGSPADILAAWLYWETIVTDPNQISGRFRGEDLTILKTNSLPLTGPFASCWGAGGQNLTFTMYQMRADVRRLLRLQRDANGRPTGKRLVNDSDLAAHIDPETGQP